MKKLLTHTCTQTDSYECSIPTLNCGCGKCLCGILPYKWLPLPIIKIACGKNWWTCKEEKKRDRNNKGCDRAGWETGITVSQSVLALCDQHQFSQPEKTQIYLSDLQTCSISTLFTQLSNYLKWGHFPHEFQQLSAYILFKISLLLLVIPTCKRTLILENMVLS